MVKNKVEKKTQVILHYNKTKSAVDKKIQMIRQYSCVHATKRWLFRFFMVIIDIAELNTYLVWITKYPNLSKNRHQRKTFLRELTIQLVTPNVQNRYNNS